MNPQSKYLHKKLHVYELQSLSNMFFLHECQAEENLAFHSNCIHQTIAACFVGTELWCKVYLQNQYFSQELPEYIEFFVSGFRVYLLFIVGKR